MAEEFGRRSTDDRLIRLEQSHQMLELKMAELVTEIKNQHGNLNQMLMLQQRMLDRHDELLTGKDGKNGLIGRANRLEERETIRTWHLRAIWVALLGGFVNFVREGFR